MKCGEEGTGVAPTSVLMIHEVHWDDSETSVTGYGAYESAEKLHRLLLVNKIYKFVTMVH